jgi:adenylate cyclase
MTPEDEPVARKMLEQAIALDPELALAHSWLAVSYMVDWFDHGSREAFDHALILAGRAVALDDDDGRCHATLAYISLYHRQFERAEFHTNRAIALMPNDFRAICGKGGLLAYLGEHGEAVDWLTRAVRLNPYPPEWYASVVGTALRGGIGNARRKRSVPLVWYVSHGLPCETNSFGRSSGWYRQMVNRVPNVVDGGVRSKRAV